MCVLSCWGSQSQHRSVLPWSWLGFRQRAFLPPDLSIPHGHLSRAPLGLLEHSSACLLGYMGWHFSSSYTDPEQTGRRRPPRFVCAFGQHPIERESHTVRFPNFQWDSTELGPLPAHGQVENTGILSEGNPVPIRASSIPFCLPAPGNHSSTSLSGTFRGEGTARWAHVCVWLPSPSRMLSRSVRPSMWPCGSGLPAPPRPGPRSPCGRSPLCSSSVRAQTSG